MQADDGGGDDDAPQSTASRRKQTKPARHAASELCCVANEPTTLATSDVDDSAPQTPIAAGTSFGPFAVKEVQSEVAPNALDGLVTVSVEDSNGVMRSFLLEDGSKWLHGLKSTKFEADANSKLSFDGHALTLTVTKSVESVGQLLVVFRLPPSQRKRALASPVQNHVKHQKYVCRLCQAASFSIPENLLVHQAYYCTKQATVSVSSAAQSNPKKTPEDEKRQRRDEVPKDPAMLSTQKRHSFQPFPVVQPESADNAIPLSFGPPSNVILLPVAFTSGSTDAKIQLLGQPQIVIPVAIARDGAKSLPPTAPLIIEAALARTVHVPLAALPVGAARADAPLRLPLAVRPSARTESSPSVSRCDRRPSAPLVSLPKPPLHDHSEPLDLSTRRAPPSPTESAPSDILHDASEKMATQPEAPPQPIEVAKPYVCACGIGFSQLDTLNGHKQFYCKIRNADGVVTPPTLAAPVRLLADGDSPPDSRSQRPARSQLRGLVCRLCGYKGYSMRGMKSHLRSHSDAADHDANDLIAVCAPTSPDASTPSPPSKPPPTLLCPRCHARVADSAAYAAHHCVQPYPPRTESQR